MIKGVNRTIIEVSNPANRYFERALLFVRPTAEDTPSRRLQLHADSFVAALGSPPPLGKNKPRRRLRKCIPPLLGWLLGFAAGVALIWLI